MGKSESTGKTMTTTTLVERLRLGASIDRDRNNLTGFAPLADEAANEIEHLQVKADRAHCVLENVVELRTALALEYERLQAENAVLWADLVGASNYIDSLGGISKNYRITLEATKGQTHD
jgi:hypothetical protein